MQSISKNGVTLGFIALVQISFGMMSPKKTAKSQNSQFNKEFMNKVLVINLEFKSTNVLSMTKI